MRAVLDRWAPQRSVVAAARPVPTGLLLLVLVVGLLAAASGAHAQGAITAVNGNQIELFLGPDHGVAEGGIGTVWRVEAGATGVARERVATVRALRVSNQSAVAEVTERVPGRDVELGLEVSFAAEDVPHEDEIVALVELGDRLYAADQFDAAARAYERASALDPRVRDAGARHVMAMVRGEIARGDRGPVFEAAVKAFVIVKQMQFPDELAAEVQAVEVAVEEALAPTPTATAVPPTPSPLPEPTEVPIREGDIVPLGPGVVPPEPTSQASPSFPDSAARQVDSGLVELRLLVGIDGKVEDVRVVSAEPPDVGFEDAAERAVRRWRFTPATAAGVKVRFWYPIRIRFTK